MTTEQDKMKPKPNQFWHFSKRFLNRGVDWIWWIQNEYALNVKWSLRRKTHLEKSFTSFIATEDHVQDRWIVQVALEINVKPQRTLSRTFETIFQTAAGKNAK